MFEDLYKKMKKAVFEDSPAEKPVVQEDPFLKECLEHQKAMDEDKTFVQKTDEVAPPGWEGTVKAMKKHKDLKNPWALAWYMKGKGAHPHYKESVKESGTPMKITLEIAEEDVKDIVGSMGGIKDIPLFITAAAEHILGRYLHPEYLQREDFEEYLEGANDEVPPKDKAALDAEQGDMPLEHSAEESKIKEERKIIIEFLKKKDPATLTEKEKEFVSKFNSDSIAGKVKAVHMPGSGFPQDRMTIELDNGIKATIMKAREVEVKSRGWEGTKKAEELAVGDEIVEQFSKK